MPRYQNLGGNSGIVEYDIGGDWISVTFSDHSKYLYNYEATGQHHVEHMKGLAIAGQGLNAFINTTVRKRYASKLR